MIKLLVTDLDGTLFYPKRRRKGLTKDNKEMALRFLDNGGEVLLASGRNVVIIPRMEKVLGRKITYLGCNGGYIVKDGKLVDQKPLDDKITEDLIENFGNQFGINAWTLFDEKDTLFIHPAKAAGFMKLVFKVMNATNGFYKEKYIFDSKAFYDKLHSGHNYKAMAIFGLGKKAKERAYQANEMLKEKYGDTFTFAVSGTAVEITAKNVNKGNTLLEYCQLNGISKDEVIVCGDSGNDIPMFERFPHSFAMAQSPDYVINRANHIINKVCDVEKYILDESLLANDSVKVD